MSTRRNFLFGLAALPFAPTVAKATPVENLVLSDLTQQDMVLMVRNLALQIHLDSIYSVNAPDRMIVTDPALKKTLRQDIILDRYMQPYAIPLNNPLKNKL